ncbi:MAG: hypothetical protein U0R81_06135 [Mycobacterium sp.]
MKWTAGFAGAVLAVASIGFATPALASPGPAAGTAQAAADAAAGPGQLGSSSPSTQLTQQDAGVKNEGVQVVANGTQGTFKSAAVDGQVTANGIQGTFKSAAVDGTATTSVEAVPQKQ